MNRATGSEVLHGGAERLPIRWANCERAPITISRYSVAPGKEISLHVHTGKHEYWIVVAGSGMVSIDEERIAVGEGDVVLTPAGRAHALANTGEIPLVFVNVVELTGDATVTTTEVSP